MRSLENLNLKYLYKNTSQQEKTEINLSREEINFIKEYEKNLQLNSAPVIYNLDHLAHLVKASKKAVYYFAKNKPYVSFAIPKKNKGERVIHAPARPLKLIQRAILDKILYKIPISKSVHGFTKGRSIVSNATPHTNKKIIVNIDIKDFFPSITYQKVYQTFKNLGYSPYISWILTELLTYKGSLPQGAPTSPMMSNIICRRMDKRIEKFAEKNGLSYTRYADDITLSGDYKLKKLYKVVIKIIKSEKFQIRYDKLSIRGSGSRQIVTGIITNTQVGWGKKRDGKGTDYIRAIIYNCKRNGVLAENRNNDPFFKERLYGYVALIQSTNPAKGAKLREELDKLDWEPYNNTFKTLKNDKKLEKQLYIKKVPAHQRLDFDRLECFSGVVELEKIPHKYIPNIIAYIKKLLDSGDNSNTHLNLCHVISSIAKTENIYHHPKNSSFLCSSGSNKVLFVPSSSATNLSQEDILDTDIISIIGKPASRLINMAKTGNKKICLINNNALLRICYMYLSQNNLLDSSF